MKVLDVCVGSEKIYYGMQKNLGKDFISIDIRKGDFSYKTNAAVAPVSILVKPKVLANMKNLPFTDGSIDCIVMDPPHLSCRASSTAKQSFMSKAYGSWSKKDIDEIISMSNKEFSRVLRESGMLIIKILPEDKEKYLRLLDNFCFFLPIHTIRQQGCFTNKEAKLAAFWCIGIKKEKC